MYILLITPQKNAGPYLYGICIVVSVFEYFFHRCIVAPQNMLCSQFSSVPAAVVVVYSVSPAFRETNRERGQRHFKSSQNDFLFLKMVSSIPIPQIAPELVGCLC